MSPGTLQEANYNNPTGQQQDFRSFLGSFHSLSARPISPPAGNNKNNFKPTCQPVSVSVLQSQPIFKMLIVKNIYSHNILIMDIYSWLWKQCESQNGLINVLLKANSLEIRKKCNDHCSIWWTEIHKEIFTLYIKNLQMTKSK